MDTLENLLALITGSGSARAELIGPRAQGWNEAKGKRPIYQGGPEMAFVNAPVKPSAHWLERLREGERMYMKELVPDYFMYKHYPGALERIQVDRYNPEFPQDPFGGTYSNRDKRAEVATTKWDPKLKKRVPRTLDEIITDLRHEVGEHAVQYLEKIPESRLDLLMRNAQAMGGSRGNAYLEDRYPKGLMEALAYASGEGYKNKPSGWDFRQAMPPYVYIGSDYEKKFPVTGRIE